ncbi:hypothetical protein [Brevundimonas sp.]|uniref:hypothetical protein n=1 Tax=Brevundimonas sp. TaxID=1871086 RepID=UPI002AB81091|nr:hypothetical protein [Brevundimonas sp.]MDZ4363772.1 hypothetical protein [Brevundimonas sp.]
MTFRPRTLMAVAVAMSLGLIACTEAEQDEAQAETNEAAAETSDTLSDAGAVLKEEAAQVGSAVAAGAREAGQEIDEATDNLEREAQEQKAETARDADGN